MNGVPGNNQINKVMGVPIYYGNSLNNSKSWLSDADLLIYTTTGGGQWLNQTVTGDVKMTDNGGMTVKAINGMPVCGSNGNSPVSDADILIYEGGNNPMWQYQTLHGDAKISDQGTETVTGLQGFPIATATPNAGQALVYSGTGVWTDEHHQQCRNRRLDDYRQRHREHACDAEPWQREHVDGKPDVQRRLVLNRLHEHQHGNERNRQHEHQHRRIGLRRPRQSDQPDLSVRQRESERHPGRHGGKHVIVPCIGCQ